MTEVSELHCLSVTCDARVRTHTQFTVSASVEWAWRVVWRRPQIIYLPDKRPRRLASRDTRERTRVASSLPCPCAKEAKCHAVCRDPCRCRDASVTVECRLGMALQYTVFSLFT